MDGLPSACPSCCRQMDLLQLFGWPHFELQSCLPALKCQVATCRERIESCFLNFDSVHERTSSSEATGCSNGLRCYVGSARA